MDTNITIGCDDRNQVNSAEQGYFVVLTKGRNTAIEAVCADEKFEVFDCSDLEKITDSVVTACARVCKMSGAKFNHAYVLYSLDQELALMISLADAVRIVKIESDEDCEKLVELSSAVTELANCMDLLIDARNSQGRIDRLLSTSKHSCILDIDSDFDYSIDHALNVSTLIRDQIVALFKSQFQLFPVS